MTRERIQWKTKAKTKWLKDGDANTHFFHVSTLSHRRYNFIHHLIPDSNIHIHDPNLIGQCFVDYFYNLFSTTEQYFPSNLQNLISPSISAEQNATLTTIPDCLEIFQAISSMHGSKSPGPDGMSPIFYKKFWNIVCTYVVHDILGFFGGNRMNKAVNHTFLALIPKRTAANLVDQFRPIALCNVIYKIVMKIIATRLKHVLNSIIHPSQAAFIPSRSILDNGIINHEVMCYLNAQKGRNGFIAIKVDMAKAYDRVEWNVLQTIMEAHDFNDNCCKLIFECILSVHYSVILNGSPCGFFPESRGIR